MLLSIWFIYVFFFISLLGCDYMLSDEPVKDVLQNPSSVSCHIKNLSLHWYPAEMPMYVGYSWSNRSNNRPLHVYLDKLTGDGSNVIVIVHLYTHFLTFHHSLYRQRVRRLSQRLEAALARLKKLTVVVKGPHYYRLNPLYRNSVFGLAYDSILKEELKRLRNKIIYLNFWDINLNSKNAAFFPEDNIVRRMMNQFMSYVCPNWATRKTHCENDKKKSKRAHTFINIYIQILLCSICCKYKEIDIRMSVVNSLWLTLDKT